jgi:Ca-activated chloride channel family protein
MKTMTKKSRFSLLLILGLCVSLFWACANIPKVSSFDQAATVLQKNILPKISVKSQIISDAAAQNYSIKAIQDPLPSLDKYPIYGPQKTNDPATVYLEIFSSSDKSNPACSGVMVAAFNPNPV